MTTLHEAIKQGNLAEVERLLAEGADVYARDTYHFTPLHEAAHIGHPEITKLLIDNGADVNAVDIWGATPLYWAAHEGRTEAAQLLVENGAEVNATDLNGLTPLHVAAQRGHKKELELLLTAGANVNAVNSLDNSTPLHEAARTSNLEVVKLLIDRGADVNVQDNEGKTPLHWAIDNGHTEIAQLLIENGADINTVNNSGETPLYWAVRRSSIKIVELLLERGADLNSHYYGDITLLEYFVNYLLNPNGSGSYFNTPDWLFSSPKTIMAILKSTAPEEATRVMDTIFADNTKGKLQKDIYTETLKQYAALLENKHVEAEQRQQLEGRYKSIITFAVQANPNLYYTARTYCNLLDGLTKKIPGNAVKLIQSYLTTERYTLHDGVRLDTRARLLEIVEEAVPQQEQTISAVTSAKPNIFTSIINNVLLGFLMLGFLTDSPALLMLAVTGMIAARNVGQNLEISTPQTAAAESSPEKLNEARETTWEDRANNTQNHSSTPSR